MQSSADAEPMTGIDQRQTPSATAASEDVAADFAIHLVKREASLDAVLGTNLSRLELEERPVISADDILGYDWESHEMELTDSAYDRVRRLRSLILSAVGLPFVVCVGEERIYGGSFWTSHSSVSYPGIVIDIYPAEQGRPVPIRLGYPSPEWFDGEDLRSDSRIFRSLKEAGRFD